MWPVRRSLFLLLVVAFAAGACSLAPERQWYKPGQNYTVADFQRDQKTCTKKGEIDDGCLKERGWVPLSGDPEKPPKTLEQQERERRGAAPTTRY
jgi:hypothetical protein